MATLIEPMTAYLDTSDEDQGFVLISVLWMVGLIAAMTLASVFAVQVQIRTVANTRQSVDLEETANGLVRLVAFGLGDKLIGANSQETGTAGAPYRCQPRAGLSATIAIQDQAGLIDLNAASADVLRLLLDAVTPARAEAVGAILDFRDTDDATSPGGAEADDYRRAGKDYGPKNAPFQNVMELDQVLGLEGERAQRLLPYVTVHGYQNGIDPAQAPDGLAKLLRDHPQLLRTQSQRQFFAIDVIVSADSGGRFHRQAIVAVTREIGRPYRIVGWQQGKGTQDAVQPVTHLSTADCLLPLER